MSCLTMMRSVTECFIVLIRKGIGWLSLKRGCAAFTTTASIFLLSWSQLSNHPENSLEPELDKLLDNYYFGSYLEKNSRNLYALAMTCLFCPKCDKKCIVNWKLILIYKQFCGIFWYKNEWKLVVELENGAELRQRRTKHFEDWRDYYLPTKSR